MPTDLITRIKTISDHDEDVQYTINPWAASDGFRVMRQMTPVMAPALLAFKGIRGVGGLATLEGGDLLDLDLSEIFAGITGDVAGPISEALTSIARAIMTEGDSEFVRSILSSTHRACDGTAYNLGKKKDFDRAFQANYGEMFFAIVQTLAVNYGGIFKRFASKKK